MNTEQLIQHLKSLDAYNMNVEFVANRLRDVLVVVLKELEYLKTKVVKK